MERQELSDLVGGVRSWGKTALYSPLVVTMAGCVEKDSDYWAVGAMAGLGALVLGGVYAAFRSSQDERRYRQRRGGYSGRSAGRSSSSSVNQSSSTGDSGHDSGFGWGVFNGGHDSDCGRPDIGGYSGDCGGYDTGGDSGGDCGGGDGGD